MDRCTKSSLLQKLWKQLRKSRHEISNHFRCSHLQCFEYISENKNFIKVVYPDKRIAIYKKNDCIDFNKWVNIPTQLLMTL